MFKKLLTLIGVIVLTTIISQGTSLVLLKVYTLYLKKIIIAASVS